MFDLIFDLIFDLFFIIREKSHFIFDFYLIYILFFIRFIFYLLLERKVILYLTFI
jgi:hypothetical protein